mmetsp:Transcript_75023/g.160693  ORF Transcript_75023/g.160693 Transcript_75023/m.160693 type:complete len:510 (-) Transcript_75023:15-1544(-)
MALRSEMPGGLMAQALGSSKQSRPRAAGERTTIWDVIEDIGVGPWQLAAQFMAGGILLADGAEIQAIASVSDPIKQEWHLTDAQTGTLTSMIYVGVLVGGLGSGWVADVLGRRLPLIMAYAGLAVLAILSAAAPNFSMLLVLRTAFGVFVGIGGPAWNTMASEITPSSWRMVIAGSSQILFQFGVLYAIFNVWLNDPQMQHINWRWQLVMSAIPSMICLLLSAFFLHESPAFLAANNRHDEALKVLDSMRRVNHRQDVSIGFDVAPPARSSTGQGRGTAFGAQLGLIFSRRFRFTTLTLCYTYFTLNLVFYGNLYAFPQVLPAMQSTSGSGMPPTAQLALGVITGGIPGVVMAATAGSMLPRKLVIFMAMIFMGVSNILFSRPSDATHESSFSTFLIGYWGLRFGINFSFVIIWQYAAESYPTIVRATGCSVVFSVGRLGAILAPMLFEHLTRHGGNHCTYYMLCSVVCFVNCLFVPFWNETLRQKMLEDAGPEDEETEWADPRTPLKP